MPGVEKEVTGIAAAYGRRPSTKCVTLVGSEATFQAVVSHLAGEDYDIVHFAGHAWYDRREAYLMLYEQAVLPGQRIALVPGDSPAGDHGAQLPFHRVRPPGVHDADIDPATRALTPAGFAPGPDSGGQPGFTGMTSAVGVGALSAASGRRATRWGLQSD